MLDSKKKKERLCQRQQRCQKYKDSEIMEKQF